MVQAGSGSLIIFTIQKGVMKHYAMVALSMIAVVVFTSTRSRFFDREGISRSVDEIVALIDGGNAAASFSAGVYTPYAFIMEKDGKLLVHPSLAGEDLKSKAMPICEALQAATPEGIWLSCQWQGNKKHTSAKLTKTDLIAGSGY